VLGPGLGVPQILSFVSSYFFARSIRMASSSCLDRTGMTGCGEGDCWGRLRILSSGLYSVRGGAV